MSFVREKVPQDQWEYFNSLNIKYEGKLRTANEYSIWVIDREREIIFTNTCLSGRDYGDSYILIWGEERIYIYVEAHTERQTEYAAKYCHWDIQCIIAPMSLKDRQAELIKLIRQIAEIHYDPRSTSTFVIDNIAEPQFKESV